MWPSGICSALTVSSSSGFPDGIPSRTCLPRLAAGPENPLIADAVQTRRARRADGEASTGSSTSQLALGRPRPDYSRSTRAWVEARLPQARRTVNSHAFTPVALMTAYHSTSRHCRFSTKSGGAAHLERAGDLLQVGTDEARSVLNSLVERGLESRGEGKGLPTSWLPSCTGRRRGRVCPCACFEPIQQVADDPRLRWVRHAPSGAPRRPRCRIHPIRPRCCAASRGTASLRMTGNLANRPLPRRRQPGVTTADRVGT